MIIFLENWIWGIIVFFLGSAIASFLGALAYRIYHEQPIDEILTVPSNCESCSEKLAWYELIPIVSYIIQKGRCRRCQSKISSAYFIGEIFLSLSFLLFYFRGASWIEYLSLCMLFFISIFDLLYKEIPRKVVHAVVLIAMMIFILKALGFLDSSSRLNVYFPVVEAFFWGGLMMIMNLVKKSFGFADVLVMMVIGFTAGGVFDVTFSFFSGAMFLAIPAMLIVIKNPEFRKKYVPFIPFLSLGYVVATLAPRGIVLTLISL